MFGSFDVVSVPLLLFLSFPFIQNFILNFQWWLCVMCWGRQMLSQKCFWPLISFKRVYLSKNMASSLVCFILHVTKATIFLRGGMFGEFWKDGTLDKFHGSFGKFFWQVGAILTNLAKNRLQSPIFVISTYPSQCKLFFISGKLIAPREKKGRALAPALRLATLLSIFLRVSAWNFQFGDHLDIFLRILQAPFFLSQEFLIS